MDKPPPAVIVSNGFHKFHLALAAAELCRHGRLTMLLTGAYPTPVVGRLIKLLRLARARKIQRLLDRSVAVPPHRMAALAGAELINAVALLLTGRFRRFGKMLDRSSMRLYGRAAARLVARLGEPGQIYHYRAGFGHGSVAVARRRGMITVCDHSIVHPALLDALIRHGGTLPAGGELPVLDETWRMILEDIGQADRVLVNSAFVKETFLRAGWPADRIDVVYWGVDEGFLGALPPRGQAPAEPRLLFAGSFEERKGAGVLVEALSRLADRPWRIDLVGPVPAEAAEHWHDFLRDPRVRACGALPRRDLAAALSNHRIMVFPSLAEGSARIVLEGMAAGLFIITTPNAGSIVEDGVHGLVVPPGDPQALAAAIARALAMGPEIDAIGAANAELVRRRWRQSDYGRALSAYYDEISRCGAAGRVPAAARLDGGAQGRDEMRPAQR